jgi:opacity protein-like surface antigen
MRFFVALIAGAVVLGGVAAAQTAAPAPGRFYAEGVAQSAFGNVTSQSFGGELGVTVGPELQVFVEAGQMRDVATSDLGSNAQTIAGALSQTQSGVAFRIKEPVTFGVAGVKYAISAAGSFVPYIVAGLGVARIRKDVSFSVGGTDATGNMPQYGVVLGTDLSGASTRPMLSVGGGVAWPAWERLVVDFQYRFGRIFAQDQGINTNRAGVGIGIRF